MLEMLVENFPLLRQRATYSLTVDERNVYSSCFSKQPTHSDLNLEDDDLMPFLPNGNSWYSFGPVRSWVLIPVFLSQGSTYLFGVERIILAEPRAYPTAFYWVFRQEQTASSLLLQVIDALAQHLGHRSDQQLRSEALVLHRIAKQLSGHPVYASTLEFDILRARRVKEHFDLYAPDDLTDLWEVNQGSEDIERYIRSSANPVPPDGENVRSKAADPRKRRLETIFGRVDAFAHGTRTAFTAWEEIKNQVKLRRSQKRTKDR